MAKAKISKPSARSSAQKIVSGTAAELREAYNNGTIQDRQILALEYPSPHAPMLGFAAFVRGQLFVRQAELRSGDDERRGIISQQQREDLENFLKTVQDPA